MIQEERFSKIIEYLDENKTARLSDISKLNGVSIDTVRRDFEQLEADGMLKRVRGGAIFYNADITTQNVDARKTSHTAEKKEIGALLENIIVDGQAISLNSGTTCMEIARFLAEHYSRLTVITNNIRVLDILSQAKNFTVIVPAGEVDGKEWAIWGDACERDFRKYNIDVAIFGIHAISLDKGITDFRVNQQAVIQAMLQSSKKRVVVADSSKFEKTACVNICGLNEIDVILSDSNLPDDIKAAYKDSGVNIICPNEVK